MAFKDTTKKPFLEDRDVNVFIGLDYPLQLSTGTEGYFASTATTIEAVKNNIRLLLSTDKGERLMQPNLGSGLQRFLFEQFTDELRIMIENEIVETFTFWMPFVELRDIQISMSDNSTFGKNTMKVKINFNIRKDPNTLASVVVDIGE